MTHRTISQSINKALIVCPTNVIRNWIDEFMKWLGKLDGDAPGIEVGVLTPGYLSIAYPLLGLSIEQSETKFLPSRTSKTVAFR